MTQKKLYPYILVITYSLLGLTLPASVTQFSLVVNEISSAMGLAQRTVLLTDTIRSLCLVIAMFLSNLCYHRFGLKKTIALGLAFQIAPQFFFPLAISLRSIALLSILKALQGLNSIAFPLYISSIVMWIDGKYKATATAVFNGSFYAGSGIGSWLAGYALEKYGLNASFYIIGALCLAFAVPAVIMTVDRYDELRTIKKPCSARTDEIIRMPISWVLVFSLVANTWVNSAITVDFSVYSSAIGNTYTQTSRIMLFVSMAAILSSALSGAFSDWMSLQSNDILKARCRVQALGYIIAILSAVLMPLSADHSAVLLGITAFGMMFGANWASGVFYSLPSEVYSRELVVDGNGFCASAANVPNPISPAVVGVMLGTRGHWTAAWFCCAAVCALSLISTLSIPQIAKTNGARTPGMERFSEETHDD